MCKRINVFSLVFLCVWASCTKVDDLSDEASITDFQITSVSDGVELDKEHIAISKDNEVSIPVEFGRKNFPLTISTRIKFSSSTDDAISTDETPLDLGKFTFQDVYSTHEFYMISESGKPHLARIRLDDKLNAEILDFNPNIPDASWRIWHSNIRITLKKDVAWPLTITPTIKISAGAVYENYTAGQPLTFESPADNTKPIVLRAENGDLKVWNVQILPSIENSDFELWVNEGIHEKANLDPTPGKGLGWATANNTFVQGTQPVAYNGGKAAQMTTELERIGFLGDMITAATVFTGYFKMNISALNDPPQMTFMGIPFNTRPVSISFDARYVPGERLQQSVKENGMYVRRDMEGKDEGRMWVKLLRWSGKGDIVYHDDDPTEGITVLGEGDIIFDSREEFRNWKNYTVDIKYNRLLSFLEPTHISIVFTSSRQGDYFIGAIGSMLTVDNVTINY